MEAINEVTIEDGKYTVRWGKGMHLSALRYGEPWRDCCGDGLILGLAMEVQELRTKLAKAHTTPDLNALAKVCRMANDKWWRDPKTGAPIERNKGELFMLIVSEIAEAMEGERKEMMDAHLPHRRNAEVELVDALIRIFDYAGAHGYDLSGAFAEKMAYNTQRADHTHAARLAAGGKKF